MPGEVKRQPRRPGGNRFWRTVRDVLNLIDAVVKVDFVPSLGTPRCVWRGPGMGPKAMGIRQ